MVMTMVVMTIVSYLSYNTRAKLAEVNDRMFASRLFRLSYL